ncbi:MAG: cytochrome b/b6 domain-containing protein [Alphaproteobacteria bacterium]
MKRTSSEPRQALVWDLPTRLFHWLLVLLFAFSWWSGKNEEVELHIWSGIAVLTLLVFRLLWGLFGSSTARFSAFLRGPAAVAAYLRNARSWNKAGHTPLGALSVVGLLLVLAAQVITGLFQTDDDGLVEGPLAHMVSFETAEAMNELHEIVFDVLLALVALHVAAILFYRLILDRKLTKPMITGRAVIDPSAEPMRPAKWWVALLCLAASIALSRWIVAGAPPFGS